MNKNLKTIILLTAAVILWQAPAHAQLWRINEQLTIRFANDTMMIDRHAHLKENRTDEILRGQDLMSAVREFVHRIKNSAVALKERQLDRIRGVELSRITESNTKDMIQRNKAALESQKRFQEDRVQMMREQNRNLTQRTRDLSWRQR